MEARSGEIMKENNRIQVDYLARVEGEAGFQINLDSAPPIEIKIFEPPRFFEGFLVGRKYDEVGDMVSRICGICPVSHMTTAIQAVEKAMGIVVSDQTRLLRKILSWSQIVASHLIHLYMLAMPDYYRYRGVVDMIPRFQTQIHRLMQMKETVNELTALIGGRALHPVTHLPGGFTSIPSSLQFSAILKKLEAIRGEAGQVVMDISQLDVPDFRTESVYVALKDSHDYSINQGRIASTTGLDIPVENYLDNFHESQVSYAYAKQSVDKDQKSFMVGALARMNIKYDQLLEESKKLAEKVGFSVPSRNPFLNNLAQSLEVFDGIERSIRLIESFHSQDERRQVRINPGDGGSVTEAPRGLLYHWYRINERGMVERANIVTPTSHNFLNMEKDLKKLVNENGKKGRDDLQGLCEKLVRAYDPCFSCSVH